MIALALFACGGSADARGTDASPMTKLAPVPFSAVTIHGGLWQQRQQTNREHTVNHLLDMCELEGRVRNLWRAAGKLDGDPEGIRRRDADLFRSIEAAAYVLITHPDADLEARLARIVRAILAAQQPSGYLNSSTGAKQPEEVSAQRLDLFSPGHLIDAALAYAQATGDDSLIVAACRSVRLVDSLIGPASENPTVFDHPKLEDSLIRLYHYTEDPAHLALAQSLVDHRRWGAVEVPARELKEATGHVIASLFLYEGMLKLGVAAHEPRLLETARALWEDAVTRRMYITGAMGDTSEDFGAPYVLDNRISIGEGCQSHALARLCQALLLVDADSRYADVTERVLFNNLLGNVSLTGTAFYYHNRLSARPEDALGTPYAHPQPKLEAPLWPRECLARQPWFQCPCCPPNIAMAISGVGQFVYAHDEARVFVNQYIASETKIRLANARVHLALDTRYPWDGHVRIVVSPPEPTHFGIAMRIPDWCRILESTRGLYRILRSQPIATPTHSDLALGPDCLRAEISATAPTVLVNGNPVAADTSPGGYVVLERTWSPGDRIDLFLPMPILRIVADPRVTADAGRVALQRGPLVYCVEAMDHGGSVEDLRLPDDAPLELEYDADSLGGVVIITGQAERADETPTPLRAVPYGVWGNRDVGAMDVWLQRN